MLIVSSYQPIACGIATFSNDIVNAVKIVFGNTLPIELFALQNNEHHFNMVMTLNIPCRHLL